MKIARRRFVQLAAGAVALPAVARAQTYPGPGRVKTKSDLVPMPSGGRIFVFFSSAHGRRAQNSGCGYTASSFHTAWATTGRMRRSKGEASAHSNGQFSGRRGGAGS